MTSSFTPSVEQSSFFSMLTGSKDNLLLEASAGSGKTTTIIQALKLIPGTRALLLAFNKDIEEELKRRAPSSALVATFHSLGLAAWRSKMFPQPVKTEPKKLTNLAKATIPAFDFPYRAPACRLVEWAKSFGVGIFDDGSEAAFRSLAEHFAEDFEVEDEGKLFFYAERLLAQSNSDLLTVDFSDMLYFPLKHGGTWPKPGLIIIDEAQDTNAVQRALLEQMLRVLCNGQCKGQGEYRCADGFLHHCSTCNGTGLISGTSRLIAVGDPHQAIYGFRGADADALNALASTFSMTRLPLATSFRCSQSVVTEAQRILKLEMKPVTK